MVPDANDGMHVAVCSCQVQGVQGLKVRSILIPFYTLVRSSVVHLVDSGLRLPWFVAWRFNSVL